MMVMMLRVSPAPVGLYRCGPDGQGSQDKDARVGPALCVEGRPARYEAEKQLARTGAKWRKAERVRLE